MKIKPRFRKYVNSVKHNYGLVDLDLKSIDKVIAKINDLHKLIESSWDREEGELLNDAISQYMSFAFMDGAAFMLQMMEEEEDKEVLKDVPEAEWEEKASVLYDSQKERAKIRLKKFADRYGLDYKMLLHEYETS